MDRLLVWGWNFREYAEEKRIGTDMKQWDKRGAGILLPVSSLPSPYGIGTLGKEAYEFVDFLKEADQSYWQVLPVGPTSFGDSPYQSFSAFAGNPYYIDLRLLMYEGLLTKEEVEEISWGDKEDQVSYETLFQRRYPLLKKAFQNSKHQKEERYRAFCQKEDWWLSDYAFFMALKEHFDYWGPDGWEEDIWLREPEALERYRILLKEEIDFWKFLQYHFFSQWRELKAYAKEKGISLIGDIPIYVSADSADLWARPELFLLDEQKRPVKVAGVPPDAFSETGQLWGNPLYHWKAMEEDGFSWWKSRIKFASEMYDGVRIDHFIGAVRYYEIDAEESDGRNGRYQKGPGSSLIAAMGEAAGQMGLIAEDLGVMIPEVTALRKEYGLPGMRVLEFAFDHHPENTHLPHNHQEDNVVYCGTHDNETLRGFLESRTWWEFDWIKNYLGEGDIRFLWDRMLHAAYGSVAHTVILQAQDILYLGNEARMNCPSTMGENWKWRLKTGQLGQREAEKLRSLCWLYKRGRES